MDYDFYEYFAKECPCIWTCQHSMYCVQSLNRVVQLLIVHVQTWVQQEQLITKDTSVENDFYK